MAIRAEEVWISANGHVAAVKTKDGGFTYLIPCDTKVNGEMIQHNPRIALEISKLNLEIMEAKR